MNPETNKYHFGKIYKITSPSTKDIYIGSTIQTLKRRFHSHKSNYNCTSVFILKYNDSIIELIEEYPCYSRYELEQRERHYQEQYEHCINIYKAGRTPQDKKDYMKVYNKKYQKDNNPKLKNYLKNYYQKNKDNIIKRVMKNTENNKEEKKEYLRQYYLKNKEKLKASASVIYTCEVCNHTYRKGAKKRHDKTKKHINSIN
jgi:ribosomal protein L37AE/L43A